MPVNLLTDHLKRQLGEVDLHVLHHDRMVRQVSIVFEGQVDERFRLLTSRALICRCALASILVRFGSLKAAATVLTWTLRTLVRIQLAPLANDLEWTDAVGSLVAIDHASIARLAESHGRTVATRTLWIDLRTVLTHEATLAQAHVLRRPIENPMAVLILSTGMNTAGIVIFSFTTWDESKDGGQSMYR